MRAINTSKERENVASTSPPCMDGMVFYKHKNHSIPISMPISVVANSWKSYTTQHPPHCQPHHHRHTTTFTQTPYLIHHFCWTQANRVGEAQNPGPAKVTYSFLVANISHLAKHQHQLVDRKEDIILGQEHSTASNKQHRLKLSPWTSHLSKLDPECEKPTWGIFMLKRGEHHLSPQSLFTRT